MRNVILWLHLLSPLHHGACSVSCSIGKYKNVVAVSIPRDMEIAATAAKLSCPVYYVLGIASIACPLLMLCYSFLPFSQNVCRAMKGTAKKVEMEVIHQCHRKIPKVRSDSLFQVFCNLIKNAVDAMQGNGLLKITISCPEDMLEVEFHDTGPGFAPEMAEAMFEPFFTTKEYGRGTGLGLAICKDIVEKYNGRIIAENAPQGGGVFTVYLPLKEKRTWKKP